MLGRRIVAFWPVAALAALAVTGASCRRSPLLAPSGSSITLAVPASALATDTFPIVAVVTEGGTSTTTNNNGTNGNNNNNNTTTSSGGTPVHNGTLVNFTTTMGSVSQADASTVNGQATVQFTGDGRAGTLTITAVSGSAVKTATVTLTSGGGRP